MYSTVVSITRGDGMQRMLVSILLPVTATHTIVGGVHRKNFRGFPVVLKSQSWGSWGHSPPDAVEFIHSQITSVAIFCVL